MTKIEERIEWNIKTPQDAIKFCEQMMGDIVAGRIKPSLANKVLADFNRRLKEAGGRFQVMERTTRIVDRLNELERKHEEVMQERGKGGGIR